MATTNGKRNRSAGHSFELECVNKLREIGFKHVVTCRAESRSRDNQGIDIINKDEGTHGRLPYNVQCKSYTGKIAYQKVLGIIPKVPEIINVIMHRQTEKTEKRFVVRDKFAILYLDDFFKMAARITELEAQLKLKTDETSTY
jgi:Restriction endonuclease